MSSGLSLLNVMNMAADLLDEEVLTSPDDDTKLARMLRRWNGIIRDQLLQRYAFYFAEARAVLSAAPTPAWGWDYGYYLPPGFLRAHPLQEEGRFEYPSINYKIENDGSDRLVLFSNSSAETRFRYIRRVENTGLWTPLFAMAHATKVAAVCAPNITGKMNYVDRLMKLHAETIDDALRGEIGSQTPERPIGDEWDNARSAPAA